jgi:integrase
MFANCSDNGLDQIRPAAVRPHDLRHTSATLLLAAGVNIRVISERLGHESIEITLKHYAHVLPRMQEKAVEAVLGMFGAIGTTGGRRRLCDLT